MTALSVRIGLATSTFAGRSVTAAVAGRRRDVNAQASEEAVGLEKNTAVAARLDPLRPRVPLIAIRLTPPVKDAEVQLDGVGIAAPLLDGKAFRLDYTRSAFPLPRPTRSSVRSAP